LSNKVSTCFNSDGGVKSSLCNRITFKSDFIADNTSS
jgi:hypothetical protein